MIQIIPAITISDTNKSQTATPSPNTQTSRSSTWRILVNVTQVLLIHYGHIKNRNKLIGSHKYQFIAKRVIFLDRLSPKGDSGLSLKCMIVLRMNDVNCCMKL